ncbi:MAG: DUF998 domain-containing protein [Chloroflexi bacterium]|nr:DUF998 domain-containing protein [Chloroflexota bacterium]
MATSVKGEQPFALRLLLACGAIGPLLFIVVFLIEGATRADYNPLRQPVSSLSIGDFGWMQVANFIITGLLLLAFAIGLRRALRPSGGWMWGPLLVGLVGIGLIGAGIFISDPLNGYPPGTPLVPTVRSVHGRLHDLFGLPVFMGLPIACFVFSRRFARLGERGWAAYSALSGFAMLVTFVVAGMGFGQTPGFADFAGVFQRLSIIIGWTWIALFAFRLMGKQPLIGR